MSVPETHLDVLVAQEHLKRLEAPASHHKPRGEGVPQVVAWRVSLLQGLRDLGYVDGQTS